MSEINNSPDPFSPAKQIFTEKEAELITKWKSERDDDTSTIVQIATDASSQAYYSSATAITEWLKGIMTDMLASNAYLMSETYFLGELRQWFEENRINSDIQPSAALLEFLSDRCYMVQSQRNRFLLPPCALILSSPLVSAEDHSYLLARMLTDPGSGFAGKIDRILADIFAMLPEELQDVIAFEYKIRNEPFLPTVSFCPLPRKIIDRILSQAIGFLKRHARQLLTVLFFRLQKHKDMKLHSPLEKFLLDVLVLPHKEEPDGISLPFIQRALEGSPSKAGASESRISAKSLAPYVREVMLSNKEPMHVSDIALALYDEHGILCDGPTVLKVVRSRRLSALYGFVHVGAKGYYALRDFGYSKPKRSLKDDAYTTLCMLYYSGKKPVSFNAIYASLSTQRPVLNHRSLKATLDQHPRVKKHPGDYYSPVE